MQRHKRTVALAAAASDGWVWPVGSLILAGSALALWTLLH